MADYRVIDIETVPDYTCWSGDKQKAALGFNALKDPAVVSEPTFAPLCAQRVVAISWVDLIADDGKFYHFSETTSMSSWGNPGDVKDMDAAERSMLRDFRQVQEEDRATLVSWNGRGFDLPVLNLRCFKHRLPAKWYYEESDVRYRYTEAGHCDLMDVMSDYGAARNMKLHDICQLVGLPGKVGPFDGSDIERIVLQSTSLFTQGEDVSFSNADDESAAMKVMEDVGRYCLTDSIQTALLFLRSRAHKGMISVEEHDAALETFMKSEEVLTAFDAAVDWAKLRML
jgi:predicted PolB exonuclease-like 3'-5' exonuclease